MLDKYKDHMKVNGFSNQTMMDYISRVKKFLRNVDLENINNDGVQKYFLELQENLKHSTINKHRDTLKHFFEFLEKDIKLPKGLSVTQKIPPYITEEYFEKEIIPVAERLFMGKPKALAILYFLFYTGLRRDELTLLKRDDIDFEKRTFKIYMPKVEREKYGYFTQKVEDVIIRYFNTEEEETNAFNTTGQQIKGIFKKLKPFFKDITKFCPRLFRHSFATLCRQRGVAMEDIKEFMGHSSINTTMRYAHSNPEKLGKIYNENIEKADKQ